MQRRAFLSWIGAGWLITRVPALLTAFLAACTGQKSAEKTADGFLSVGTIAELDQKGQLSIESPVPILVVRNPTEQQSLIAVNPTCTHQGCLVAWKAERKSFACPCHNAAFAADGKVLQAPADKPLATYSVKVDGQKILVKA